MDLGCGTGSLAVLLAEAGHRVRGVDSSPAMVELARRKARAAEVDVELAVADAAAPPYGPSSCDVDPLLWGGPVDDERYLVVGA